MTFKPVHQPDLSQAIANKAAVFAFKQARFSFLTARLVRMEFNPSGMFEDLPSQQFWYRRQQVPLMQVQVGEHSLRVETEALILSYTDTPAGLTPQTLQIELKENGLVYHYGDPNPDILPGTARTLDETNGPIHLHDGLVSRAGWVVIDDTPSLVFNTQGWIQPRAAQAGARDLYFLAGGSEYATALREYQKISGFAPMPPRYMLGNWWSRFWEYTQDDVVSLVQEFQRQQIPLSVFIIDMDWHITQTGNECSGWTGFSWNRKLFPHPEKMIAWLHEQGLQVSMNLHPAEGIHAHEDQYPQAAKALGLNPASREVIPFDIADPRFTQVYFEQLLHPLEAQGVDFWWIDWQQGMSAKMPGLDPLWWLNHLHFVDLSRDGTKRPVVFSRWGGPGNQRYPIGFSGDTVVSWKSLAFQPFFTAAAANAAYGWWSHDIGGHMQGMEDRELYTRWVQFGVLSPIFRLHCTKDDFIDRSPWAFDAEVLNLTRSAMQFRHALIPYLYSMAHRNEMEGIPLVTPLYYGWPEEESAYAATGEYLFGSQLLAAPVISQADPDLRMSRQPVYLPPGDWFNFFDGELHQGDGWEMMYHPLADMPLFARAGAILQLQPSTGSNSIANPRQIDLVVFPGADGRFELYEDDGQTTAYRNDKFCTTEYQTRWAQKAFRVNVRPVQGDASFIPDGRSYRFLFRGVNEPDGCKLAVDGKVLKLSAEYDPETHTYSTGPVALSASQSLTVSITRVKGSLLFGQRPVKDRVMRMLKLAKLETVAKWRISTLLDDLEADITALKDWNLPLSESQLTALVEIITGAGAAEITSPDGIRWLAVTNPKRLPGFKVTRAERYFGRHIQVDWTGKSALIPLGASEEHTAVHVDAFGLLRKRYPMC